MPTKTVAPPRVLPISPRPDLDEVLPRLIQSADLDAVKRAEICRRAADLVRRLRSEASPSLMEVFLAEYGLSTEEGVALMCLAEALLRVPDDASIDALIEDKIAPGAWSQHLGQSSSPLVNASTWALMLTGRVLDEGTSQPMQVLADAVKRLGEPVIRNATEQAMKVMGRQFVLGEDMDKAMDRAAKMEANGYTYSYDMLGEAAITFPDAKTYRDSYARAIDAIGQDANEGSIAANPGISVKLSALHPRYEMSHRDDILEKLPPMVADLAARAASLGIGFNIDAEEQSRLELSLEVIERVLEDPRLAGWNGFGIAVQAYGPRAGHVIDWIDALATKLDRKLMVRLVKGAYWDTEIKLAQQEGLDGFPVLARKAVTDVSFISNARKLLEKRARIYPQFATHNAHTVAAVLCLARDMGIDKDAYEFQRLHGMGEALYDMLMADGDIRCRIYAPVGEHQDLLAYLVRRLLENGANSAFVNQIVDESVSPESVASDPFENIASSTSIATGPEVFEPQRENSRGWDLSCAEHLCEIEEARSPFRSQQWHATPIVAVEAPCGDDVTQRNPANPSDIVGKVSYATSATVGAAVDAARPWTASADERAAVLVKAARLFEENFGELFAVLAREAGKTLPDAVAELREAVDFLYYYAKELQRASSTTPRGRFVCISPWNFPLAIFTGQIAAALAAGNAVLAKPAEQTPLVAAVATGLLHKAGVPREALQLLPGAGDIGAALTDTPSIDGVAFTGSTETARKIKQAMAENAHPSAPLIAETGGLNAMIVDSTALPEQAVADIIQSAFQSAGQRCSACRCVYVQADIYDDFLTMLKGAMDAFTAFDPWELVSDSGPLIDGDAHGPIQAYVETARHDGRLLHQIDAPETGWFLGAALVEVDGIEEIEREIFGPVLHIAKYDAEDLGEVVEAINGTGYGLTFGLHTRIDDRVQYVIDRIHAGNLYINRNQIGAIVGSQPFGGEGLSGTGPKAGGPFYLPRFQTPVEPPVPDGPLTMPGPTGELNCLYLVARPPALCLGPSDADTAAQKAAVERLGGVARVTSAQTDLSREPAFASAIWWGDEETARDLARALAQRAGPLVGLVTGAVTVPDVLHERHVCIDTTASGGNAQLLAEVGAMDV